MKDVGVVELLVELVRPLCAVIESRRQQQDGQRVRLDGRGLLLQQPARLLVQPALDGPVQLRRAHLAPVGRGVVDVRQRVHGVLHIADVVAQPDGGGEQACALVALTAAGFPDRRRLLTQRLHAVDADELKELGAALAVRQLREHGEGHVDVHRREHGVFLARAGEKLRRQRLEAAVRRRNAVRQSLVPVVGSLRYHERRASGPQQRRGDDHDKYRRDGADIPGPAGPFALCSGALDQLVGDVRDRLVDLLAFFAHISAPSASR